MLCGWTAVWLAGGAVGEPEARDWRLELLAAEGISAEIPELLERTKGFAVSEERFHAAVGRLGAEKYAVREKAEHELLLMGKEALPLFRQLPKSDDPEVRTRLNGIVRTLAVRGRWTRDELLRHAISSLLREQSAGSALPERTLFAEFFSKDSPSLEGGYGRFGFEAGDQLTGSVSDGVLRLRGAARRDGDQRLVLTARELTGDKEFPDAFRIEVKIGGEEGGEGTYHVGVSFGNVRALFHPGYKTGGFRFQRVHDRKYITRNTPMGFDPPAGQMLSMSLDVKRLADGAVEFRAGIASADGTKVFENQKVVGATLVGNFGRIGLERSGRVGGDALFDDLVVDLGAR